MATPLEKPIRRELRIDDAVYTVTIDPERVRIVPKGKRLGREMTWRDLLSGGAELSAQLHRSLEAMQVTAPREKITAPVGKRGTAGVKASSPKPRRS